MRQVDSEASNTLSRGDGDGDDLGARSAPSVVKLVLVVAIVSSLCTALVTGKVRGGRHPFGRGEPDGGRGGAWERANLRKKFRQLDMMGFEESNGQGGEWRTCRAYEESGLGPDKKVCCF